MKVHNFLGCGFQEIINQKVIEIEMNLSGLSFQREFEMSILYREIHICTEGWIFG